MQFEDVGKISDDAFQEIPHLRGLRVARVSEQDGRTLEVLRAVKGVVIPTLVHPAAEQGKILEGAIRFVQNGESKVLSKGDTWSAEAGESQGPHMVLEHDTCVAILRNGPSALG